MLSFAKFYDKINTSLVFFLSSEFFVVYIIYSWGYMFEESPPTFACLKRYTRQGFADFTPCKNKLTLNIVKLFIKCYNIYNNVG